MASVDAQPERCFRQHDGAEQQRVAWQLGRFGLDPVGRGGGQRRMAGQGNRPPDGGSQRSSWTVMRDERCGVTPAASLTSRWSTWSGSGSAPAAP